jgi:outer membrane receptor protein involved in Fe transport
VLGGQASQTWFTHWGERHVWNTFGLQVRGDRVSPLELAATEARQRLSTTRRDRVSIGSVSPYFSNTIAWTPWLRTIAGLRADFFRFDVSSDNPDNSGKNDDSIVSPKLTAIFGPWRETEYFLNWGQGFHSNDARGTTITVDPADPGTAVDKVKPLVRTTGYEFGLRSEIVSGWQSTVALWQLESASELLFVGDAGTTEASRPSRRYGVEWTNLYTPTDWLAIDADLAWSHARFRDQAPEGDYIPGAVATTANLGLTLDQLGPWFGALRFRYFGPRPLNEDNTVRSSGSALTNLRIGYRIDRRTQLALDVYNLFDKEVNDIEYWYDSQLATEASPVFDRHVHPAEPRTFRLTISHRF